jgi:endonuclease/exonuclease/phosphatase family metal-dependent hydrolase
MPTMKLITLNTMGGRIREPLIEFLVRHASDTDIFCLQELFDTNQEEIDARHPGANIDASIFRKISDTLPDFRGTFAEHEDDPHRMSSGVFIKRTTPAQEVEDFVVYKPSVPVETGHAVISSRKLQHVRIQTAEGGCSIINYHGLWVNGPKTDTPERLEQSRYIMKFISEISGPKIVCGDFNILPDTESMAILEKGMRNLIKEFDVASTRTPLYRHYDNPEESNFADYILVSPDVKVTRFEVLPDVVSDHAPVLLEFT